MPLTTLFLDLNSFFASVEQQERPELRGQPVAVVPVMTERTSCIAASYEAKAFGVKTGTPVHQAMVMCPGLRLIEARPRVYVEYHHRIVQTVEQCLPITAIGSIDEMHCRLMSNEADEDRATALALRIKQSLRDRVGACMRCSIGIAPNRFLAKVASDMRKPDGLVVLRSCDLPAALHPLKLIDLPGIGPRMERRLRAKGVHSVQQLCALDESRMAWLWESVVGRVWWHWLRGHELPEPPTVRRTLGHQHVLPPELRTAAGAYAVLVRLIHKAAARLRREGYWAAHLHLDVKCLDDSRWESRAALGLCRDTLTMLEALRAAWPGALSAPPIKVAATLTELVADAYAPEPIFPADAARARLADAMDRANQKFGPNAVYFGGSHHVKRAAPMRIAFHVVPDLDLRV
jgi:DNA polymerase-4